MSVAGTATFNAPTDVAAGIGVGARHYLVKPVKLAALEDMVKSILRRS